MATPDTIGLDEDDVSLVTKSLQALHTTGAIELVTDEKITKEIAEFFGTIRLNEKFYTFYPKNIIKIQKAVTFYIVQCLLDFGYEQTRGGQRDNSTELQVWGYAVSKEDLGNTIMRPETRLDKMLDWITKSDIDFEEHKKFSDEYYLSSNQREKINRLFTPELLDEISQRENLHLYIRNTQLLIGFLGESLSVENTIALERILSEMGFLERG